MLYQLHDAEFLHMLDFKKMTRQDARNYFSWYISQIPIRTRILEIAIQSSSKEFSVWKADNTEESLLLLSEWFYITVEEEPVSEEQQQIYLKNARASLPEHLWGIIEVPKYEITRQTWSLIIDIGMYFGETLRHHRPTAEWKPYLATTKKNVDFQQPILIDSETRQYCNPQHVMHVTGLRFCNRSESSNFLPELFQIWIEILAGQG